MGVMRPSGKEAKPHLRLADLTPVGRPGHSLVLGIASLLAAVPPLIAFAPYSRWGSGVLLAALAGVAIFSYFGAVLVDRSVMLDAGFVVALAAVVFLGPLPAACIWIATEIVAVCVEKVRATAFFANVASFCWAAVAGGLVMTMLGGGEPLADPAPTTVAAVALAGLLMQAVNYFVVRALVAGVRDGRNLSKVARTELLGSAPVIVLMTAVGTATVFLYMEIGVLALGLFALAVQVPLFLLPALMRPRPVAELDHTGAVRLYALAIADVLDLGYRKCQVLKDAAQFIRERPLVPRDGELSSVSTEHRLALVESVLYYREHWDGRGGKPGAFGGDMIPVTSRILAVADAWAGLTSKESPQLSHAQVLHQLESRAGMHFDPAVVAAAAQVVEDERLGLPARVAYQPKIHRLPLPRVAGRLGVAVAHRTAAPHDDHLSVVPSS
jgi:HD domain-containing protein